MKKTVIVTGWEQGWGKLQYGCGTTGEPGIRIGGKKFSSGFGTHADGVIRFHSFRPLAGFHAFCGADENLWTKKADKLSLLKFSVRAGKKTLARTPFLKFGELQEIRTEFPEGTVDFELVLEGTKPLVNPHGSWGCPEVTFSDGEKEKLGVPEPEPECFCEEIPVSFRFGEQTSGELFALSPLKKTVRKTADGTVTRWTGTWKGLRMETERTEFRDYPVQEWHTVFSNPGKERSPRLHQADVLSLYGFYADPARLRLVWHKGSFHTSEENAEWWSLFKESYRRQETVPGEPFDLSFSGVEGRPTASSLPCFDLTDGEKCIRFVLGWSGQWRAQIRHERNGGFRIRGGMEDLDTVLEPGESITQPSVFILKTEKGGDEKAANLWRRFVSEKIMPPGLLPVSSHFWGGMRETQLLKREEFLRKNKLDYDVFWVDAGWFAPVSPDEFDSTWSDNVGDWKFDRTSFPQEMARISGAVHKAGKKLLLWFEPERVRLNAELARKHPEFLIFDGSRNALLDLGDPAAWQWCFDTLSGVLRRNCIDWLRIDFNFSPRHYWRKKDGKDRKGITEIRYCEGVRRLWKTFREEFPGLMIDNCASGGRRLDIELCRYSFPLWYSDMQCGNYDPEYSLVQNAGLASYLPKFAGGVHDDAGGDTFKFRASMNAGIGMHVYYNRRREPDAGKYPVRWYRERMAEYRSVQECMAGDFYCIHLADPALPGLWTVFQYDLPEQGRGCVQLFRPGKSPVSEETVLLRGLAEKAEYEVRDTDGHLSPRIMTGKQLMTEGLSFRLAPPHSSDIIIYHQRKG